MIFTILFPHFLLLSNGKTNNSYFYRNHPSQVYTVPIISLNFESLKQSCFQTWFCKVSDPDRKHLHMLFCSVYLVSLLSTSTHSLLYDPAEHQSLSHIQTGSWNCLFPLPLSNTCITINYYKHPDGTSVTKLTKRHFPSLQDRGKGHFPQRC